jgi:DNA-binding MarR family transcriptional regulator
MEQPDAIIHQPLRLKIMAALNALPKHAQIEFMSLKPLVGATDGNLGAHIVTLENAGYAEVEKDFVGKKPRTRISLTTAGRRSLAKYTAYLREILDLAESHDTTT